MRKIIHRRRRDVSNLSVFQVYTTFDDDFRIRGHKQIQRLAARHFDVGTNHFHLSPHVHVETGKLTMISYAGGTPATIAMGHDV